MGALTLIPSFLKLIVACIIIPMYRLWLHGYMDYVDLAVRCSRKAVKLNHSLTHSLD